MRNSRISFGSRRSIRLPGYDYRQAGVYFVTLCTNQMASLFGAMNDGEMIPSELGQLVVKEWQHMSTVRRNVKLDHYVLMPNHFHALVVIDDCQGNDLAGCTSAQSSKESHTLQSGSLGAIIGQFKLAVGRQARRRKLHPRHPIWQRNYHEHIVRNEASLNDIRKYIIDNPARWREDSLYVG